MLGLSTSYFAFGGKGIYDSVKSVFDLGFEFAELGAGHRFEKEAWETVKMVKKDFPGKHYTVHALFPPLEERQWFNPGLGLTSANRKILDNLFKTAAMVEAKAVGIHPGFSKEVGFEGNGGMMSYPVPLKEIPLEEGFAKLFEVLEYGLGLAKEAGCDFAIENTTSHRVMPLVFSREDFEEVFQKFPELKLLLDTGHALCLGWLQQFVDAFGLRVGEMHLHISRAKSEPDLGDEHRPVTSLEQLEPLRALKQFKEIPVIFEHGPKVSERQILAEKKLVEGFEKGI